MGKHAAAVGERLRAEIAHVAKMLVLEIDRQLRLATPVATGHARRNWVPSIGSQHTGEVPDDAAHEQGIAAVLAYTLGQGVLWVSNAAPYMRRLNYGWSKKKPAGFIERAVDIAMQVVQAKLRKKGSWIDLNPLRAAYQQEVGAEAAGNVASAYSPFGDDE